MMKIRAENIRTHLPYRHALYYTIYTDMKKDVDESIPHC